MPVLPTALPRNDAEDAKQFAPGNIAAPVPFWNAVQSAANDELNENRLGARTEAYSGALWQRDQQLQQTLGHPLTFDVGGRSYSSGRWDTIEALANGVPSVSQAYEAAFAAAKQQQPQAFTGIPSSSQVQASVAAKLTGIATQAASDRQGNGFGSFVGSTAASLADPINLMTTVATAPIGGVEGPLAAKILLGGAKQAAIWGGVTAAEAPLKMQEAQTVGGPAYTVDDAKGDVASAAAGGFLLHGASEVLGAAAQRFIGHGGASTAGATEAAPLSAGAAQGPSGPIIDTTFRDVTGEQPQAAQLALPAPSVLVDADTLRGALQEADKAGQVDQATGPLRAGSDYDAAQSAVSSVQTPQMPEATQDPGTLLTPEDPNVSTTIPTPPSPSNVAIGEATTYRGRPIYGATFDPSALQTAPDVFQYKSGADGAGLTDRLRGVQTWDPTSAGRAMVWEDPNGGYVVADGHQRLGLAQRLSEQDPQLDSLLFRSQDGWTAQDVRTVAALKNIREGSGTPLDAAKILREHPDALNDDSLPITGALAEQGRGLARLSDDAFGSVVNEVVPQHQASLIGNMAGDRPDLHAGMMDLLAKGKPANADEARALVSEALEADWAKHEGAQDDMFGGVPEQSTVIARAKVRAAVLRQVRGDAKMFTTLTRQADAIEAGGNSLARTANEAALATNRAAEAQISKLAYRDGDIGQAMRDAASEVVAGAKPADAANKVAALVRRAIQDGERAQAERKIAIDPDGFSSAGVKRAADFEQPGGKAQAEQIGPKPEDADHEAAARTGGGDLHPAARGLFDDIREPNPAADALNALRPCAPE